MEANRLEVKEVKRKEPECTAIRSSSYKNKPLKDYHIILTGVNQVTSKINSDNMQKLDTEFVETSWHSTARPTHQVWQGRVFYWDRANPNAEKIEAGVETVKGVAEPKPVSVEIDSIDETHVINTDELKEIYDDCKIVDTRTDKEYNGKTMYGEANGGHLPGAIQIRYTDLFNSDSTLKSNEDLTKMFEDAGLSKEDHIITYCTGGIRSAYMQLVMEMCGFENSENYDESFYRWCVEGNLEK